MWSELRREALKNARVDRGKYKCSQCLNTFKQNQIEIHHIIPATPKEGLISAETWGLFIWNLLFITVDKTTALCKSCHLIETNKSKEAKYEIKKKKKTKS